VVGILEGLTPRFIDHVVIASEDLTILLSPPNLKLFLRFLFFLKLCLLIREENWFSGENLTEVDGVGGFMLK
jgi:hypothetical protein